MELKKTLLLILLPFLYTVGLVFLEKNILKLEIAKSA